MSQIEKLGYRLEARFVRYPAPSVQSLWHFFPIVGTPIIHFFQALESAGPILSNAWIMRGLHVPGPEWPGRVNYAWKLSGTLVDSTPMNVVGGIGRFFVEQARAVTYLAAVVSAALRLAVLPRHWPQTVRNVLARQILFTGVEATRFISLIALLVGVSIVVQVQMLLSRVGQSELLGPILVAVIIRELGPLLTNFVVIGRSGAAITTELGNMKVNGEICLLDAQGLDPFTYLVLPRMLGMMISIFALTVVFIVVAFASGFVSGLLMGANTGTPGMFVHSVMKALTPADVFSLLAKTMIPGLLTGAICCTEGMSIEGAVTEVPQATTRSLVRSVGALFIVSALVSLLIYI